MADVRKTAFGAVGLTLLALWFADSGGPADDAVKSANELAHRQQAQPVAPQAPTLKTAPTVQTTAPPNWFAPDEDEEPVIAAAPNRPAAPDGPDDPTLIRRPPPKGPDFPTG